MVTELGRALRGSQSHVADEGVNSHLQPREEPTREARGHGNREGQWRRGGSSMCKGPVVRRVGLAQGPERNRGAIAGNHSWFTVRVRIKFKITPLMDLTGQRRWSQEGLWWKL